jgi:hypothetical protein
MAPGPGTDQPGQLRATFRTRAAADEAVRRLREEGVPADDIRVDDTDDRQHMLLRQQQLESERSVPVTGSNLFTPAQAKGAALWAVIGGAAGAVVFGLAGLFFTLGDLPAVATAAVLAFIGALAGGSAGFVYGGGRQPEVDGEVRDPSVDVTVAVRPTTIEEARTAIATIEGTEATDAEYETTGADPLAGDAHDA